MNEETQTAQSTLASLVLDYIQPYFEQVKTQAINEEECVFRMEILSVIPSFNDFLIHSIIFVVKPIVKSLMNMAY